MTRRAQAEHGIVCRMSNPMDSYMGWASAARPKDGALAVGGQVFAGIMWIPGTKPCYDALPGFHPPWVDFFKGRNFTVFG